MILEDNAADAARDFGLATSGARACAPTSSQSSGGGSTESQSSSNADVQVGTWSGTRTSNTSTISPAHGVSTLADYAYFLRKADGLLVVELDIGFDNVAAAAQYQQKADQLASTLMQRLDTL